jgi:dTDP-4-dehydrorhamnose reductase
MKILLFGKDGQVGWELQRSLACMGDLIALDFDSPHYCGDFTKPDKLVQTVASIKPGVIVNAAAYTAVDKAEAEPELARLINAESPARLAQAAQELGAWLIHYSTDYVFDGSGQLARTEKDTTNPLNVYGQTKLEGEQRIRAVCEKHLIFRTSWVYAARGGNFVKTMLKLAQEKEGLQIIDDQVGAPTGADLLADITAHAIRQVQQTPELSGLYHVTAAGETSWYEYAKFIFRTAEGAGVTLKTPSSNVSPVSSDAFKTSAKRPLNSRLNCQQFKTRLDMALPPWQLGVERMLKEII